MSAWSLTCLQFFPHSPHYYQKSFFPFFTHCQFSPHAWQKVPHQLFKENMERQLKYAKPLLWGGDVWAMVKWEGAIHAKTSEKSFPGRRNKCKAPKSKVILERAGDGESRPQGWRQRGGTLEAIERNSHYCYYVIWCYQLSDYWLTEKFKYKRIFSFKLPETQIIRWAK